MLYEREGLAVKKIEFVDNQDCIGKLNYNTYEAQLWNICKSLIHYYYT